MNPRLRIIVIGLVVITAATIGYGIFSAAGNPRQRLDQSFEPSSATPSTARTGTETTRRAMRTFTWKPSRYKIA